MRASSKDDGNATVLAVFCQCSWWFVTARCGLMASVMVRRCCVGSAVALATVVRDSVFLELPVGGAFCHSGVPSSSCLVWMGA